MPVNSSLGATFAIGTTAAATNQTQYESDTYTLVGEIENVGEFGDAFAETTFGALADGRVRKFKGLRDAGTVNLTIGMDTADAGQTALAAALEYTDADDYNFKVVLTDGDSSASPVVEPTVVYFSGKVMSRQLQGLSTSGVTMVSVGVAINTALIEVAAA